MHNIIHEIQCKFRETRAETKTSTGPYFYKPEGRNTPSHTNNCPNTFSILKSDAIIG